MRWRLAISALAGAATALVLALGREFFWQHALIVGLAVGALTYSVFRTGDRLRGLRRR